ncbi:selenoprotein S-like [Anneissia japonica]|uniref:selenoprotein S-like n=1 Tax=Anneissia japonica TaxID=1529436 RepID=UPI0014256968|nr:selenoprotein S-like [Anneissia japonica]
MSLGEESQDIQVPNEPVKHPNLVNETPETLVSGFNIVTEIIVSYGWYILLAVAALFYLRHKFQPQISQWQKEKSDRDYYIKYDTKTALKRQEGRERALMRMQEENDRKAKEIAEKQKQKEEQKRLEQVEEWENHKEGKSYRSKLYRPKEEESTKASTAKKSKPKTTFRPTDFNPLMGGAGGGYRPSSRFNRSGGG